MRVISIIFYLFLLVFGVTFSVLNAKAIELNLYFKTLSLPIPLLLIMVFAFGVGWGLTFFLLKYMRLKMAFTRLKHQLALSEKEVKNLRSIPIQNQH